MKKPENVVQFLRILTISNIFCCSDMVILDSSCFSSIKILSSVKPRMSFGVVSSFLQYPRSISMLGFETPLSTAEMWFLVRPVDSTMSDCNNLWASRAYCKSLPILAFSASFVLFAICKQSTAIHDESAWF